MIIIHFHKYLQKYTKLNKISLNISSFSELKDAIKIIFPELQKYVYSIENGKQKNEILTVSYNREDLVPESWILRDKFNSQIKELWIIPSIIGSGRTSQILIGIGLIAAAFLTAGLAAPAGAGLLAGFSSGILGTIAKITLGIGINLLLAGIFSQTLKPKDNKPSNPDSDSRKNNNMFDALQNSLSSNQPVLLNFGLIRIAGHFASGYIKTINHGSTDIIRVGDTFVK